MLTLELVPGLLEGTEFAPDPVVLGDPVAPTFNRTIPFVSRQWVASEMTGAAEGAVPGAGCRVVCAFAATTLAAINSVVPTSLVSIGRSLLNCVWAQRLLTFSVPANQTQMVLKDRTNESDAVTVARAEADLPDH